MISQDRLSAQQITRQRSLAEAYEAEARAWRRKACLAGGDDRARMRLFLELAGVCDDTAARIRLGIVVTEAEAAAQAVEPSPELRTIQQVTTWLLSDPSVCEGWKGKDVTDVQRMALALLDLREGIGQGRWRQ